MQKIDTGGWAGVDAERFHEMARIIINGFTPYISYVDPKPPLLFFVVSAMDLVQPAGFLDLPVITSINIICALLLFYIGNKDYGYLSGFFAGFLYLIVVAFAQGYILFSEQFAVMFLMLAFISARKSQYIYAGICVGLAFGFKQYAILGLVPLLYLMWKQKERRFHYLIIPTIIVSVTSFAILLLMYGSNTMMSAVYWTFGVAPAYISGQTITEIPSYQTNNLFSFSIYLISSVFIVLPVILFSGTSVILRGLRSPSESTIFLFVILLSGTLLIRQYLHYWILILPFLILLACREFAEEK
ncbi:MAG: hypothetical protein WC342_03750 [Methanoregula sp.]|jgi:uncharacterized membrane protein